MAELSKDNTGVIIWFQNNKGYGYIARDNGEKDLFLHYSNIEMEGFKSVKPGQRVSFELGENHKGQQAVKVKVLSEPEPEVEEK